MERTEEEFAIEFGEYMAKRAETFMRGIENGVPDPDAYRALNLAIYEFRKRARKTNAWLGQKDPTP